jgi:Cys-rich repeat protein
LNTLVGFENLPGAFANGPDQLRLAQCFADPAIAETIAAVSNPITGPGGLGFVPLPAASGTGAPFCQDFHEGSCPGATNAQCTSDLDCPSGTYCFNPTGTFAAGRCEVDACANNPAGIPSGGAPGP